MANVTLSLSGFRVLADEARETTAIIRDVVGGDFEADAPWGTITEVLIDKAEGAAEGTVFAKVPFTQAKLKEQLKQVQKAKQALEASIRAGDSTEETLEKLLAIPHPTVRKIVKAGEKSAELSGDVLEDIYQAALYQEAALKQVLKVYDRIENAREVAAYTSDLISFAKVGASTEGDTWEEVARTLEADLAPDQIDVPQTSTTPAPHRIEIDLAPALAAFEARIVDRQSSWRDAQAAFDRLNEILNELGLDDVLQLKTFLRDKFTEFFDLIDNILDQLPSIDTAALDGLIRPLESVVKVLTAFQDATQPLFDLFGGPSKWINDAIEKVEKALGIAKLEQIVTDAIADAIEDAVGAILGPIRDAIDAILDPLTDLLNEIVELYKELYTSLSELVFLPIAKSAERDVLRDEGGDVGGRSILVGTGEDDVLRLALDDRFDDGRGGMANGGAGDDLVLGTELADLITGGAGDDTLDGAGGNDQIIGGAGANTIIGGDGNDELVGGADNDRIRGDDGDDVIAGAGGDDTIRGGAGNDTIDGGAGADLIEGRDGNDTLYGGDGEDQLNDGAGSNLIDGGAGLDRISTFGDSNAVHVITDTTAVLNGGAGRDIVQLGDAFGTDASPNALSFFAAGAGRDMLEVGSLDLTSHAARFTGFETLRVTSETGARKLLQTITADLADFDRLELTGDGDVTLSLSGAPFNMNALFTDKPFLFDLSGLARKSNLQDGPNAGNDVGFGTQIASSLLALEVVLNGPMRFTGLDAVTDGLAIFGSDGADTITGGGGSDVIRAGLGADVIDGGRSDAGDRFDLDGAVGDVIVGTVAELDGDVIRNLSNRVDRVRIEGSEDYYLDEAAGDGETVVSIYASEAAFDGGADVLGTFKLEGIYPKLRVEGDSYVDANGATVAYTEIFNNNVPPVAAPEAFETGWHESDGIVFDPYANDFDPDTDADAAAGVVRRQIALPESVALFLRAEVERADGELVTLNPDDEDGAREGFADIEAPITGQFQTELGNVIEVTSVLGADGERDYTFEYVAREQTVAFRRLESSDPFPAVGFFDTTEDLPFFGRDTLNYKVFDLEGELSREVNVSFLIRPEVLDADGNVTGLPSVTAQAVRASGAPLGDAVVIEMHQPSGNFGTVRNDFFDDFPLIGSVFRGNDYFDIAAYFERSGDLGLPFSGSFYGRSGNDVLDGRGVDIGLALFGGLEADWVEGGDGDDFLSGGGIGDVATLPATRVAFDGAAPPTDNAPNILLGGAGRNVLTASVELPGVGLPVANTVSRDTIYVLDGNGQDLITGPMNDYLSTEPIVTIDPAPDYGSTAIAAAALQDDRIVGFGDNDTVMLPIDFAGWYQQETSQYFIDGAAGGSGSEGLNYFIQAFSNPNIALLNASGIDPTGGEDIAAFYGLDTATSPGYNAAGEFNLDVGFQSQDLLTYSIAVSSQNDPDSDPSATRVSLTLDAFDVSFSEQPLQVVDLSNAQLTATWDYTRNNTYLDPGDLFAGNGITFDFLMDGFYRADRFNLELVSLTDPNNINIDIGATAGSPDSEIDGRDYTRISRSEFESGDFGLAITYQSFAPETVADTITTERGEAVLFNIFDNDTDADGDALQVFNVLFDSAEDEARLLDGDLTNGELIQETEPNSGFGTGNMTYVDVADEIGVQGFSYIAWDGEFQSEETRVEIIQTGLAPDVGDDLIVLAADVLTTGGEIDIAALLANDSDAEGDALTITEVMLDGLTLPVFDGKITLPPSALTALTETIDAAGTGGTSLELTYQVEDTDGAGVSQTASVRVARAAALSLEDLPPAELTEDGQLAIDLGPIRAGGFGLLTVTSAIATIEGSGAPAGDVSVSGDALVFTPLADLSDVTVAFAVTVTDAIGQSETTSFSATITPVDDAAEAVVLVGGTGSEIEAVEDQVTAGQIVFADPDQAEQPVPVDPGPYISSGGGVLTLTPIGTGGFAYTFEAAEDFAGRDQVSINVALLSDPATVEEVVIDIDVTPVDDAPRFVEPLTEITVTQGEIRPINALDGAFDVDGTVDPNSIEIVLDDPSIATVVLVERDISVAAEDAEILSDVQTFLDIEGLVSGVTTLNVTVADENGNRSDPRQIEITINAAPEAVDDRVELFEGAGPILINAIANDSDPDGRVDYLRDEAGAPIILEPQDAFPVADGETADFGLLGSVTWSEVDGAFLYTPPSDPDLYGQTDVFFYVIEDDNGAQAQAQVLIDLFAEGEVAVRFNTVNDPSNIMAGATPEVIFLPDGGGTVTGTLADFDGDQLLAFGFDSSVQVTDLDPASATLTVTRNTAPAPDDLNAQDIDENPTASAILGTATLDAVSDAALGTTELRLDGSSGSAVFLLPGAYPGRFDISASATGGTLIKYDPSGSADGQTVLGTDDTDVLNGGDGNDVLIGRDGNDVLVAGAGDDVLIGGPGIDTLTGGAGADLFLLTAEGGPDEITDFNPYEGDRIVVVDPAYITDDGLPALEQFGLKEDGTTWQLIGDPNVPDFGDGTLPEEVLATFTLPDPATFEDLALSVEEDGATDVDMRAQAGGLFPDAWSFDVATGPGFGSATITADGQLSYQPDADFVGTDNVDIRLTVETTIGAVTRLASVTFDVTPVDDAPVAQDSTFATHEDVSVAGQLLASDADNDTLAFSVNTGPAHGSLTLDADGGFLYTPDADFFGTDHFVFDAVAGGQADSAVAQINIAAVNDAPVAQDDTGFTSDGSAITIDLAALLSNDSDVDADALILTDLTAGIGGSVATTARGIVFTPEADFNGTASFSYRASDGDLVSALANVFIAVTPQEEPYADFFQGSDGRDVLWAWRADTREVFGAGGNDVLIGSFRDDGLAGGDGDDLIIARWGSDFVDGGAGFDRIRLGGGRDEIRFATGSETDVVFDFKPGKDVISLDTGVNTFAEVMARGDQQGRHTVFDFGEGDELVLRHTMLDELAVDDFLFV